MKYKHGNYVTFTREGEEFTGMVKGVAPKFGGVIGEMYIVEMLSAHCCGELEDDAAGGYSCTVMPESSLSFFPNSDGRWRCHDCGAIEGQIHSYGCDMERCPFCGNQLITCNCCYVKLGLLDYSKYTETFGIPPEIYSGGLTEDMREKWIKMLEEEGRRPFIRYPSVCRKCGRVSPQFFNVSDEEWEKYIQLNERNEIICPWCYKHIKEWTEQEQVIEESKKDVQEGVLS